VKHCAECFDEQGFLLGKDGAEIKNQPIVLHARDHRNACRSAAQPLFQLPCGIPRAGYATDPQQARRSSRLSKATT